MTEPERLEMLNPLLRAIRFYASVGELRGVEELAQTAYFVCVMPDEFLTNNIDQIRGDVIRANDIAGKEKEITGKEWDSFSFG